MIVVATCAAFALQALAKIAQDWVFLGFLMQIVKINYFDRNGYGSFIMQIPCQKILVKCTVQISTPTQVNHLASLAKWLSVHLQTKWLWVRVPLQSLKLKPMHLQAFLPTSIHINNISYLLQSLDKQSFLYNFL